MGDQKELRKHRCAIFGTTSIKKDENGNTPIREEMFRAIDRAIADGYTTFVTGAAQGYEMSAARYVIRLKESNPNLHLAIMLPWRGFQYDIWQLREKLQGIIAHADAVRYVSNEENDENYAKQMQWVANQCAKAIIVSASGHIRRLDNVNMDGIQIEYVPPKKEKGNKKAP